MELPPTPPPQGLGYYPATVTRPLPASIMVISIFAIVIGALTVLCDGMTTLSTVIFLFVSKSAALAQQNQFQTVPMKVISIVQLIIGFALGGVLLAGGIGGVQVRAWARKLLIRWAATNIVYQLLTGAIGLYFALAVTMPAMQQQFNKQPAKQPMPPGMITFISAGSVLTVVISALVLCILPICILIFWRRPNVIEAFESRTPSFG